MLALWHLYARPRLREALGVTALDSADLARRLGSIEEEVAHLAVSEDSRARRLDSVEGMATRLVTSESYHARMGGDFVRRLGALEARDVLTAADLAEVVREARAAMLSRFMTAPGDEALWSPTWRDLAEGLDRAAVLRRERAGRVEGDDAGRGS